LEDTIDLRQLGKVLFQRFFFIISFVLIAGGLAAIISLFFIKPTYEAQTQLLINEISGGEVSASESFERDLQLINTYNIIIKSPTVLDVVIEDLQLDMENETLNRKIFVSNEENSKVVNLKVEDEDPELAVEIVNSLAEVVQEKIPELMSINNITILSSAKMMDNPKPVKPNVLLNIVIGLFVGFLIGVVLAFILETLDSTIKGEQHVEDYLQLPMLGVISSIPKEMNIHYSDSTSSRFGRDKSEF